MAQTILYYPTINIQDSAWLRNAVLYWDEVSSIVPYEDYPNFSPEVLFLQRSGVYKAVYPQKLFSSEFAEDFCNSIVEASNPVPTPLLGHRCRSSQEITGSPTPFSTSNHYLWICESASFSLSNPNIAA